MSSQKVSTQARDGDRRQQTRARLLEAACMRVGRPDGLTARIEEICAIAQVSRTTFYNHFQGMEELYAALWQSLSAAETGRTDALVQSVTGSRERIRLRVETLLERARADPTWGWAMVNLATNGVIAGDDAFANIENLIRQGMAAGEFQVRDMRSGRDIVVGACLVGMATVLRDGDAAEFSKEIASLALKALE